MLTKQVETAVTDAGQGQDAGIFTAIASAYSTDRQNERVVPGAFEATIKRWQESGKTIPLAWDHGRDAEDIIGSIYPDSLEETDEGLVVEGDLDLEDSELAREAWRSVKANRVGLSFGYVVNRERKGEDGATELTELDLFEITLTSTPANGDARILSAKSLKAWLPVRADYDDQEWADSCVLDRADCSEVWAEAPPKQRYALPITDPGADEPNPEALAVTADALAEPATLGNVCDQAVEMAKARLLAAYDEAEVEPPESLQGKTSSISAKSLGPIRVHSFPVG